jgi:hypothetical protein
MRVNGDRKITPSAKVPDKYEVKNMVFAKTDTLFLTACECAKLKPTTRQGSKWRNEKGRAFACRFEATSKMKQGE